MNEHHSQHQAARREHRINRHVDLTSYRVVQLGPSLAKNGRLAGVSKRLDVSWWLGCSLASCALTLSYVRVFALVVVARFCECARCLRALGLRLRPDAPAAPALVRVNKLVASTLLAASKLPPP